MHMGYKNSVDSLPKRLTVDNGDIHPLLFLYPRMGDKNREVTMPKGVPRHQSIERSILHRLAIARGHLNRVIQMVETGHYCIDIVHQSMAVQAALREVDHVVLKNHMETCVAESIRKGQAHDVINEMMKIWKKSS